MGVKQADARSKTYHPTIITPTRMRSRCAGEQSHTNVIGDHKADSSEIVNCGGHAMVTRAAGVRNRPLASPPPPPELGENFHLIGPINRGA